MIVIVIEYSVTEEAVQGAFQQCCAIGSMCRVPYMISHKMGEGVSWVSLTTLATAHLSGVQKPLFEVRC